MTRVRAIRQQEAPARLFSSPGNRLQAEGSPESLDLPSKEGGCSIPFAVKGTKEWFTLRRAICVVALPKIRTSLRYYILIAL